ncbi:hypothetical protein K8942_03645 [Candidatus Peribacteria bacterium]|nr:MAG: hypothetical protein K8942_03645 [Candidatus Peribacteria bacterium]
MQGIIITIVLIVIAGFVFLIWKARNGRKLSEASVKRIQAMMAKTNQAADPAMRILEYDKILDQLFYELGFQGNTADKLKKGGARFPNIQTLWKYHKMRNVLAHEHGATAQSRDADGFRDALMVALARVS